MLARLHACGFAWVECTHWDVQCTREPAACMLIFSALISMCSVPCTALSTQHLQVLREGLLCMRGGGVTWCIYLTKGVKGVAFCPRNSGSNAQEVHGGLANHQIDEMRLKCTGYPRDPSLNPGLRRATIGRLPKWQKMCRRQPSADG
uniref:Uncharacterized protein n=1 Tax=Dunaliella tertiolecta TaxID=3047 RepID=A0A7S3R4M9_DUNTE